jgi:hypothetical protein
MTDYRPYCLDGVGKISTREWIEATGDAEAIMIVRAKKLSIRCELWDQNRLVATIDVCPFGVQPVSASADAASANAPHMSHAVISSTRKPTPMAALSRQLALKDDH